MLKVGRDRTKHFVASRNHAAFGEFQVKRTQPEITTALTKYMLCKNAEPATLLARKRLGHTYFLKSSSSLQRTFEILSIGVRFVISSGFENEINRRKNIIDKRND
ncbi:hypothetical protein PoB_002991600 [Plakobranchus ocellatus]|uniref:Uncharacterized protein n=1 Tax=Plakobranchus ocellatus TaxID=259542 RepID=A0AAV4A578_9GAST|nr:hypothetical protein PoB_002991600 [Plakobranchus ocellatus]